MSPISWLKSDAWRIFCALMKGCCSALLAHISPYIRLCLHSPLSCSGSQCGFTVRESTVPNESRLCSLEQLTMPLGCNQGEGI